MFVRLLVVCCASAALVTPIVAAPPSIESVAPGVGQRGAEFQLTITGARLADPQELMLYVPGVVCTKLTAKGESEVTATMKAAADCKLGEYAFRLRTKGGASDLRTFRITPLPVILEVEPNDTRDKPQVVALNVSIAGVVEAADVDTYAVTLKKGQRLSAEIEGVRLGFEVNDTALAIHGPDGQELAAADDNPLFHQDPFASIVAPVDGRYNVQVRDTNFGGGDNHRYVLHLGTFARPAAIYPAGGQAATEVSVKLIGDAAGERTAKWKLPATGGFEFRPTEDGIETPTANPFRVSPFANVDETEPNDEPKQSNAAVAWPIAFNGIIGKPGDADHFRFTAKKGDAIDVQAFAFRIGSPTDTVVAVLDAQGELVASNDDDETHDSRVLVSIPADGDYFIRVTDKRKQGGAAFIYRIELAKPTIGLTVFLAERNRKTQDRHVIAVPRGNRVTAFLAIRRDDITGPVTITANKMPTGVKSAFGTVAENEFLLPVVFEAAADAPLGGQLVELIGKSGQVTGGFTQEVILVRGPGDSTLHAVTLSKLAVVVIEESPLTVTVVTPAAPLAVDGRLDVTVKIVRGKDFDQAVEVSFPCLPPGVEVPTTVVIAADKTEAVVTLVASAAAELGDWRLIAEATMARPSRVARDPMAAPPAGMGTSGGRRPRKSADGLTPVASEVQSVKLAESPVKGTFAPSACEQGKTVKVICNLAGAVGGNFTAKLDGLPPRATAKPVDVKADGKQIEFLVTVDATTPPGEHKSLVCELTGAAGGQKIVYHLGRDGSLKIDAPGAVKTDVNGKPLSPLDILRLEEKKK